MLMCGDGFSYVKLTLNIYSRGIASVKSQGVWGGSQYLKDNTVQ